MIPSRETTIHVTANGKKTKTDSDEKNKTANDIVKLQYAPAKKYRLTQNTSINIGRRRNIVGGVELTNLPDDNMGGDILREITEGEARGCVGRRRKKKNSG